ncbi:MAG: HD domain-containing phosphohydrolase [Candidatus Gorgyraea atricola]|nr:HD domain-containing phosphohydrolase [Candidatus Gorgyraea atricola]
MKKKFEGDVYFTPKQAAEYFNLSLSTIKNYIYAGKLRTLKTPGGHHRISKAELFATLDHGVASSDSLSSAIFLSNITMALFNAIGPAGKSLSLHVQNVSELCSQIAKKLGLSDLDLNRIKIAGLVHDIGHIGIDKSILLKSGPLSAQEYELIKKHPTLGHQTLSSIKELNGIADLVIQHHERIDGTGYPKGLKGSDIHVGARIIAIAEAYDSMVSEHSYKTPVSKNKAIAELMQHKGTQFDKDIVEIFTKII